MGTKISRLNKFQYIMVSHFERYWDEIIRGRYSGSLINNLACRKLPEEADVLFIKRNEVNGVDSSFSKAWLGKVSNFKWYVDPRSERAILFFEVKIIREVDCPSRFIALRSGWYINPLHPSAREHLIPDFVREIEECRSSLFEKYCFYLLRSLGIHTIHAFPPILNKGKADGYFLFQDLCVVYDATLNKDFRNDERKRAQIASYIDLLQKDEIEIGTKRFKLKGLQKQVWIITRGSKSQLLPSGNGSRNIKVKEVPVSKLLSLYYERMENEIDADELERKLRAI